MITATMPGQSLSSSPASRLPIVVGRAGRRQVGIRRRISQGNGSAIEAILIFGSTPAGWPTMGLPAATTSYHIARAEPYFDKWVVEWYEIKGLTGVDNDDFKLIRLAVALRHNCKNKSGDITPAAGLAYMNAQNPVLTPHHAYECYVQLVPRKLNALSHRGTAAALRAGEIKC